MRTEFIDTLIIGGGQAGLAMSHMLSQRGCPNIVEAPDCRTLANGTMGRSSVPISQLVDSAARFPIFTFRP